MHLSLETRHPIINLHSAKFPNPGTCLGSIRNIFCFHRPVRSVFSVAVDLLMRLSGNQCNGVRSVRGCARVCAGDPSLQYGVSVIGRSETLQPRDQKLYFTLLIPLSITLRFRIRHRGSHTPRVAAANPSSSILQRPSTATPTNVLTATP